MEKAERDEAEGVSELPGVDMVEIKHAQTPAMTRPTHREMARI
jgi:hypothetical protein